MSRLVTAAASRHGNGHAERLISDPPLPWLIRIGSGERVTAALPERDTGRPAAASPVGPPGPHDPAPTGIGQPPLPAEMGVG